MPYIELSSGTRMFYTDSGEGLPVLSMHGWACDGSDWAWFVAGTPGYRHLVVDHRGHGRSSIGDGRFSPRLLAEDAAELTDRLGTGPCIVVGHSMGGGIAATLATLRPKTVAALVLVDPGIGFLDLHAFDDFIEELRADPVGAVVTAFSGFYGPATPSWLPEWHRRRLQGTSPETILGSFVGYLHDEEQFASRTVATQCFRTRTCPTLTFWAGSPNESAEWDRTLPHGEHDAIEVWTEHGHFLHQEAPDRFVGRFLDWLKEIDMESPRSDKGDGSVFPR